jgi:hypothetical protein
MARNFLATISPIIERDRDRIHLPQIMIDEVLAEAHAWVGTCHVDRGENFAAIPQLAASLRLKPRQPRVLGFLALSLLPARLTSGVRSAYRSAKARLTERP